jgi:RND family efflux transporter MFP subunit
VKPAARFSFRRAFVLGGVALGLAACGKPAARPAAGDSSPAVPVRIAPATREELPVLVEATGSVRAVRRAEVAAKVMGTIEELPVLLGQRVKKGDVIARIAAAEIAARVQQGRAALAGLQRDFERERNLAERGAGTREAVAALQDRIATAEAVLKEAQAMQDYTTVRAPFDGAVARRIADAGDVAAPGVPLVEVEGTDDFEIEAEVPESLVGGTAVGREVEVDVPSAGVTFNGRVAEVAAAADARTRSVTVKIAVPRGTAVRSGQFARLKIPSAPASTVLVAAEAVAAVGQIERVFVVGADHRALLRLVKSGARRGDRLEILAGLNAGERVVVAPAAGLRDGARVEIKP